MSPRVNKEEARRARKVLHQVVTNDKFLDVVGEAGRSAEARGRLAKDPRGHMKGKGFSLPEEVTMKVTEEEEGRTRVQLMVKTDGGATHGYDLVPGREVSAKASREALNRFKGLAGLIERTSTSDEMLAATEGLEQDAAARAEFKANPRAFLIGKGVDVPDEVEIEVSESDNPGWCWHVCVTVAIFFKVCGWTCIWW